ncbi:hypothetical protein [Pseudomonas sp. 210_17 TE3656]
MSNFTGSFLLELEKADLKNELTDVVWQGSGSEGSGRQMLFLRDNAVSVRLEIPDSLELGKSHDLTDKKFEGSKVSASSMSWFTARPISEGKLFVEKQDTTPGSEHFKGNFTLTVCSDSYPDKLNLVCLKLEVKKYNP